MKDVEESGFGKFKVLSWLSMDYQKKIIKIFNQDN
jgi:hypothetical protein